MVYKYKKLNHLYQVHETYTAGVILEGWEVKALDENAGDINVGYCMFEEGKLMLNNVKITPLKHHNVSNDFEKRQRILLLKKSEMKKIREKLEMKGFTCVPSRLYRNDKGLWKVDIAMCTGLKNHDRRAKLKEKDLQSEMKREY
jgi:SsrA-binding protein